MSEESKEALESNGAAAPAECEPASKKIKKKWVVLGTVAAVVVAAAIGMFVWHEQPSFCGTVCHLPMSSYVESLEDETKDVSMHYRLGNECLDCHEASVGDQIREGVAFVTGNYTIPLEDSYIGTAEFCTQQGCHEGGYEELATRTEGHYNPHASHYEDLECYTCHSLHGTNEYWCTSCHVGLPVPEGWEEAPMY